MKSGFKLIALMLGVLGLSACSSVFHHSGSDQTSMSAQSVSPTLDLAQKTAVKNVTVSFVADGTINPNAAGQAQPVMVKIYQLTAEEPFDSASLSELKRRDVLILGGTLLRQSEFVIKPGQSTQYRFGHNSRASYLGVIALFKSGEQSEWKVIKDISGRALARAGNINVHLSGDRISVS